ncbi:MAG: hypothetical protein ACXW6K_17200, partial [Candidatus Binatia bacterium]
MFKVQKFKVDYRLCTTKCFMSLRSPTEHKNGWHSQNMIPLNSSFPRTRESRFVLRRISLDTRFRGYDGA